MKTENQAATETVRPYTLYSYILWGAGALSLGTGVYFNMQKTDYNDKADKYYDPLDESRSKSYLDDADQAGLMRNICYGAGAASLIAGTVLFFITDEVPVALYTSPDEVMISYNFTF